MLKPRSWNRRRVVVAAVAAGGVLAISPSAYAVTGTGSTQTTTFTPSPQLSITASPVTLGAVTASSAIPVSLGSVTITDTEADSTNWSASVAGSNCFPPTSGLPSTLNTSAAILPATAMTFDAGSGSVAPTVALTTGTPADAIEGGTHAFVAPSTTGSLATPTFGTPVSVAYTSVSSTTFSTDSVNNDGTYVVTPSMSLDLSGASSFVAVPYLYTCTLQYTITG